MSVFVLMGRVFCGFVNIEVFSGLILKIIFNINRNFIFKLIVRLNVSIGFIVVILGMIFLKFIFFGLFLKELIFIIIKLCFFDG